MLIMMMVIGEVYTQFELSFGIDVGPLNKFMD